MTNHEIFEPLDFTAMGALCRRHTDSRPKAEMNATGGRYQPARMGRPAARLDGAVPKGQRAQWVDGSRPVRGGVECRYLRMPIVNENARFLGIYTTTNGCARRRPSPPQGGGTVSGT